jgi:hypothetical protein
MGVRLIPVRPCDELIQVDRELGMRKNGGYVLYDGHRRVVLVSQSVARIADVIRQLIHAPGSDFDPQLDSCYSQGLYALLNGGIQKRYHKTWRIERVELRDLPHRFAELRSEGFRQCGIVATSEANWKITLRDT